MVKNMDKEYRCDIDYKLIYLWDSASNPEDKMNKLAAQGYKIHSQNNGIIIMMKKTYSGVTKPKPSDIFYDGKFYDLKAIVNECTGQCCKGTIYVPNYTYSYKEIEQLAGSFANYLADTYHVRAQVAARRDDSSELNICCIEALPEEEMY